MKELYRRIGDLDHSRLNELVTVTSGERMGLKVLLTEGKIVWSSEPVPEQELARMGDENIFREKLCGANHLIVCGCGYVGLAMIRLGVFLGWHVSAVDDREEYTGKAKEAGAQEVLCGSFEEVLSEMKPDPSAMYVIMTRGHECDRACLGAVLKKPFFYIGMMGSRKRGALMKETLRKEGVDEEMISLIHTPIGLSIGAQTPGEIAVSVAAQIIEKIQNGSGGSCFPDDLWSAVTALCKDHSGKKAVLATVTKRRGSAPRRPGARMLVYPDASTVGTIGGGLMEAEVIRQAADILKDPASFRPKLLTVDLTGRAGSMSDMVCGGETDVFLEMIG